MVIWSAAFAVQIHEPSVNGVQESLRNVLHGSSPGEQGSHLTLAHLAATLVYKAKSIASLSCQQADLAAQHPEQ